MCVDDGGHCLPILVTCWPGWQRGFSWICLWHRCLERCPCTLGLGTPLRIINIPSTVSVIHIHMSFCASLHLDSLALTKFRIVESKTSIICNVSYLACNHSRKGRLMHSLHKVTLLSETDPQIDMMRCIRPMNSWWQCIINAREQRGVGIEWVNQTSKPQTRGSLSFPVPSHWSYAHQLGKLDQVVARQKQNKQSTFATQIRHCINNTPFNYCNT